MSAETARGSDVLGRRVRAARELAFAGREKELEVFRAALRGGNFSVLYVHGPGGVGKSALLRMFQREAAASGRVVTEVDGRVTPGSPAAFEAAAEPVLRDARAVLLVDAFDQVQALEAWLWERFLPRVPTGALVAIAGRFPPDMLWQADPGWEGALEVLALRGLAPADARALLDFSGVPDEQREPVLAFASGHPLALRLRAAAIRNRTSSRQDVVAALLDQMVGPVPSEAHLRALEVCAHAYVTTEDLLRTVLPDHAGALFPWLRRLPFVESSGLGLVPHDVVREVLESDFRWRDPQAYADMHDRIHAYLAGKVRNAADPDVPGATAALLYLHQAGGAHEETGIREDVLRAGDTDTLIRMATAAEGEAPAAGAGFWARRRPESFRVYRRAASGEPLAYCAWLCLPELDESELAADPVVAAAWEHARATAPLRPGEHLAVGRVWVPASARDAPVLELIMRRLIGNCLRTERLAWSYLAAWDPCPALAERFRRLGMPPIAEPPAAGRATYGLFAHDWRTAPASAWLEHLNRPPAGDPGTTPARLAVLSRAEFEEEVRKALRRLPRLDLLAASPLTRTRLITERSGQDPATALHDLLRQAIDDLREDPRSVKFHRTLAATFLSGTPTQQLAAEKLGLPLTTFRRHLTGGIERVCADLWHSELYGRGRRPGGAALGN
ncbi:AAA family ATPase [Nonomuraea sp. NPDC059023]|uniref:AAA family ATPase n=1 Tax=unclassified Nonomuraea TaxID=2593643 RepID=UPI0036B2B530